MIPFVRPAIEGGRWPIKRAKGESVEVHAGVVVDSHETLAVELVVESPGGETSVLQMQKEENDEYSRTFDVTELGRYSTRFAHGSTGLPPGRISFAAALPAENHNRS